METLNYILMADIIDSSRKDQKGLMEQFAYIVSGVNKVCKKHILSPLTITLGDEFQGVAKNLAGAAKLILALEEKLIAEKADFKLRYVLLQGRIETPINKELAYGMLGKGLTDARKSLQVMKEKQSRFWFEVKKNGLGDALNDCFLVYQSFIDLWKKERHYELITHFLELKDYKEVAVKTGKTRSQIWKLEKSLKINEYIAIKNVIHYLSS
jgi:hypothetical protein